MPAPALATNVSLETLRDDIVFTQARIIVDDRAKSQKKVVDALLAQWAKIQAGQLDCWDAQTVADALITAADVALDAWVVKLARKLDGTKLFDAYFKKAPHLVAAPVLGEELDTLRPLVGRLAKEDDAELRALGKSLAGLVDKADKAVTARSKADEANDHYRTRGALGQYRTDVTKKRDGVFAAIDGIASQDEDLSRDYASSFFRKRTVKLNAEEKKARADKKVADKAARDAKTAALATARANVKAALAQLKSAKGK